MIPPDKSPEGSHGAPAHEVPRKLSVELAELAAHSAETELTLRDVITVLKGRAYNLLTILLTLPFLTPVPVPGLSTPFGIAIAIISLRLALGQKPWLPERLLNRRIPAGFFGKIFTFTTRIIRFFETFLKPRASWLTDGRIRQVHAVLMFASALVLLLPLPIPFTNTFPAWVVLFMTFALLERDGVFVIVSYLTFIVGAAYFFFLGEAAQHLMQNLIEWLKK